MSQIVDYPDDLTDADILRRSIEPPETTLVTDPEAGAYPIPSGRGRWRLTLHNRTLTGNRVAGQPTPVNPWARTMITELPSARSRVLTQQRNNDAQLTFTMNGRDPACAQILEMQHDVYAWRWDEYTGRDVCMFRGVITNSEDQLTAESHVVTFTCHDYLSMLTRRAIVSRTGVVYTNLDQDTIASRLIESAQYLVPLAGSFTVSALLPLWILPCNPDGTTRGLSGVVRTRQYAGGSSQGELLDNLANVLQGFEYDLLPNPEVPSFQYGNAQGNDAVRIFYPQQGVTRTDFMLIYGGNVSTVTRALNSTDYMNYARVIGNNGSSDPNAAQQAVDAFSNADPQLGVWGTGDNGSSDQSDTQTIQQRVSGMIQMNGTLLPSYTLGLRPGRYRIGRPNMGDTVTLRVASGRLNVNTPVRVVGIEYGIGDDGDEDVKLTVGRPAVSFNKLFQTIGQNINALARR